MIPCKNFIAGNCNFGKSCHFAHTMPDTMGMGGEGGGGDFYPGRGGPAFFQAGGGGGGGGGVDPAYYQAMGQSPLADYSNFNGSNGAGKWVFELNLLRKRVGFRHILNYNVNAPAMLKLGAKHPRK